MRAPPDRRPVIRRAPAAESDEVARLYRCTANTAFDFLAPHTPEEDAAFFRRAFDVGPVWAAMEGDAMVGFCATRVGWIEHLYVAPERQGRGVGRALLAQALKGRRRVRLWTFQRNLRARSLYTSAGFAEVLRTDGARNEEREPDVMMEWRRPIRPPRGRA